MTDVDWLIDWLLTITATVSPQVVYLIISVVDAASVKLILCLHVWHTKWLHAVLLEINTMIMIIKNLKTLLREHPAIQEPRTTSLTTKQTKQQQMEIY